MEGDEFWGSGESEIPITRTTFSAQHMYAFKSFFDGNRYHRFGWSPASGWHFRDHSVTRVTRGGRVNGGVGVEAQSIVSLLYLQTSRLL